jgi:hypothetical protein
MVRSNTDIRSSISDAATAPRSRNLSNSIESALLFDRCCGS